MRRRLFLLGSLLLFALLTDGAYVLFRLSDTLLAAADGLEQAGEDLQEADLAAAERDFVQAFQDAEAADRAQGHPAFQIARALPWIGNEATAVRALSQAAGRSAQAGLAGVDAARALGAGGGELTASVYENGRVNFAAFDRAQPFVADAHRLLGEADSLLETSPEPRLPFIEDALVKATREIDRATDAAGKGSLVLETLPSLLGKGSVRQYLLAFQSPSEARGTGGLVGLHGVLEARNGQLELLTVGGIDELALSDFGSVEAPAWFREHYGPLSATRQWQQANESPHFPVVAEVLLRMYDRVYGEDLDGVIAMDPLTLEHLLTATGPLRTPGLETPVSQDNVAKLLMHDSYVMFPDAARQSAVLGGLIRGFWGALQEGDVDAAALAKGVAESAQTQHLKVYSREPEEQDALRTLGATGDYVHLGPNVQMVFHNNFAANKVDWFLDRRVETSVRITAEGEARVTTTLTLRNDAPPGPPGTLLGNPLYNEYAPGVNGLFANFLLPEEATVYRFHIDGERTPYILHRDGPYPVAWDIVKIPPGGTSEVFVRYRVPGVLRTVRDDTTFEMTLFPQGLVRPDDFVLTVSAPEGTRLIPESSADPEAADETFTASGKLDETLTVRLRLER
ncbi:MAG: DUF4012 domain-containing protein [Actinomycetota bacterium]|nr:DUF4012 domain-containing protein [Actinomycetota bacterium]